MKKLINLIKNNRYSILIFLLLFIIPFFWFKKGEVDYGSDSTRLYFYNPLTALVNYFIYSINPSSGLFSNSVLFSLVPFLLLLTFLKSIFFNNSYFLNNFFNGFLLSGSFFSIYLIMKEFNSGKSNESKSQFSYVFSGLFFVFSPLIIYNWERALEAINQIYVYPLVFLFFLKYLNTKKIIYLILLAITTFVFSINFNFGASSWLFAFFPLAASFLFFYALINQKLRVFVKGIFLSFLLFTLVNFFHLIPQIISLSNSSNSISQMIFSKSQMKDRGLSYFLSVQPHVRLTYNLTNQPAFVISKGYGHQFEKVMYVFGIRQLALFFIFPILICVGIIFYSKDISLRDKKLINLTLIFFLVLLFLMTANITNSGQEIYKKMFYLPGFQMFRSFYVKFAIVYIFFYSLLLGFSVELILKKMKSVRWKRLLMFFLACLVLFNGWPLISGKIVNPILWNSNNIRAPIEMDPAYEKFINLLRDQKLNLKILSLPLANDNYQILQGKNGGAYLGPSSISFLTGKRVFCGVNRFSIFWPQIQSLIEKEKYSELKNIFGILNIGYIFHNNDNYIYDNFPSNPYSDLLKKIFPDQESISKFVEKLGVNKIISEKSYHLYLLNNPLPIFYLPKKYIYADPLPDLLSEIIDASGNEQRLAIYSENINFSGNNVSFDNYLVKGTAEKERDSDYFAFSNIDSCQQVFFPYVKSRAAILRPFVLLKERLEEFLVRNDLSKFIDKKLFFANKRLNEATTIKELSKKNINLYEKEIAGTVFALAKKDKTLLRRPDLVYKVIHNLKDNLGKVDRSDMGNRLEWENTINKLLIEAAKAIEIYSIGTVKYDLSVPVSGEYSILLKGKSDKETQIILKKIYSYSVTLDNGIQLNFEGLPIVDKNGWINFGKIYFEKGEEKVTVNINLKSEELNESVLDWQEDTWYRLQGSAKPGGKIELITEDNRSTYREFCADSGSGQFEYFVKSPINAVPVKITGEIKSLNIIPVFTPSLLLKLTEDKNQMVKDGTNPKITFLKINPTKYRIKVENAVSPYVLVFSESFHPGWKLYLSQSSLSKNYDTNFKNIIASYFNGEIKEGNPLNIFLNIDFFETWGKKAIAENNHYLINGYANSWNIIPEEVQGKTDYELVLEYTPQNIFLICSSVSLVTFLGCILFLMKNSVKMLKINKGKNGE